MTHTEKYLEALEGITRATDNIGVFMWITTLKAVAKEMHPEMDSAEIMAAIRTDAKHAVASKVCALSDDIIDADDILATEIQPLPADNWYSVDQMKHAPDLPVYGCAPHSTFVLVDDGAGERWLPVVQYNH